MSTTTRLLAAVPLFVACGDSAKIESEAFDSGRPATPLDGSATIDARPPSEASIRPPTSSSDASDEPSSRCVNLQCQQLSCSGGGSTSVSGTVYDPAGKNPLYNVAVFVPNTQPQPFVFGATCDRCDDLYTGTPIAATLTDAAGHFKLENVPVGNDIPLVIQIGKWRRQLTLASVQKCVDNPQPDRSLRLPKNRREGDIPKIAISTGGADTLECLLRRVGLDAAEYGPADTGEGRIHIFHGNTNGNNPDAPNTSPAAPESSQALWNSAERLQTYDIVLLSCEGDETQDMNQQALHDYASAGGRVFASHFHYSWFNSGPYGSENLATWSTGGNNIGRISATIVTTLPNGQPFAKGQALQSWLGNVGALQGGKLALEDAKHNADVSATNTPSQPWIVADQTSSAPGATQYFSFNTPTDALANVGDMSSAQFCGRVVFSDLHVGAASEDDPEKPVPTGCTDRALSPQEAALEFMLFDLSSCIMPEDVPPTPPPVVPII
jgi:hypothetical protein